jgi:hypothetical protein
VQLQVNDEPGNDLNGSGRGLIEILSRNLYGGTGENQGKHQWG